MYGSLKSFYCWDADDRQKRKARKEEYSFICISRSIFDRRSGDV